MGQKTEDDFDRWDDERVDRATRARITPGRADTMSGTDNLRAAEESIRAAERVLAQARRNLEKVRAEAIPDEPDAQVIMFKVRHDTYGRAYTYAALRAKGRWHLTGRDGKAYTWKELVEWMRGRTWVSPVDTMIEHGTPLDVTA